MTSSTNAAGIIGVGDFNRDGKLDLLFLLEHNNGYTLFVDVCEFGNGDGTFQTGKVLFPNLGPMVGADVNGDGYPDIVSMTPAQSAGGIKKLKIMKIKRRTYVPSVHPKHSNDNRRSWIHRRNCGRMCRQV